MQQKGDFRNEKANICNIDSDNNSNMRSDDFVCK